MCYLVTDFFIFRLLDHKVAAAGLPSNNGQQYTPLGVCDSNESSGISLLKLIKFLNRVFIKLIFLTLALIVCFKYNSNTIKGLRVNIVGSDC